MMSANAKNIIVRAVLIRIKRGELLNEVIGSYVKLSDKEKKAVLEEVKSFL